MPKVVAPSPTKCLAQATTRFGSRGLAPWKPRTAATPMSRDSSVDSPKPSYVRPQRSSRTTATMGAKVHWMPVARTSSAVTAAAFSTSAGLRVQPRPMLCGKIVAPSTLECPCTASMP